MHVFVYEHLCATASPDAPESLLAEGRAMLSAVLDDLPRIPGVQVSTLLAPDGQEASFRRLARTADWSLVIAPESDGCLADRCAWVEQEGGRLLGPSSTAVRLCADKLALADHFQRHVIPSPRCRLVADVADMPFPLVCKPRDGAGSQATFLTHNPEQLADAIARARREGWQGQLIAQPFVPGRPVSVSFLAGSAAVLALPAADQHLSVDGCFHYQGGTIPLPAEVDRRARRLAERAVCVVNSLFGYFGVDLVLGPDADGSADQVIEINPRLTSSYVGLRRLARFNLAEALLALAGGQGTPRMSWHPTPIAFRV
jgi:predicted ATP-grasp superfamily ATP-dependent carboligase